ncbi:uncharacterized protein LOC125817596 [Solanum verrucosum]|uniref:uncharacterized protein LOC125817596 n=1 Tax=Solanum verrucosum TaxID=315347 RepID=UPI0020D14AAE|nr:uncharacterized protein LOC125817596 [Solanum verrucosum]
MAQQQETQIEETESIISSVFFFKIMSKRRTWVFLFISVYAILLSISWNFLKSVLSWYESTISADSSNPTISISSSGWPALYASVLLGVAFGVLSMVAALAVVLPATLVTWITILVLLTFAGKPRRDLMLEGKKLTLDIIGFVIKILIKEGNVVAALCAVLAYFVLLISRNKQPQNGVDDH